MCKWKIIFTMINRIVFIDIPTFSKFKGSWLSKQCKTIIENVQKFNYNNY